MDNKIARGSYRQPQADRKRAPMLARVRDAIVHLDCEHPDLLAVEQMAGAYELGEPCALAKPHDDGSCGQHEAGERWCSRACLVQRVAFFKDRREKAEERARDLAVKADANQGVARAAENFVAHVDADFDGSFVPELGALVRGDRLFKRLRYDVEVLQAARKLNQDDDGEGRIDR